jgi:hypothetical protein
MNIVQLAEMRELVPGPGAEDELRRVLSRVDTAAAWLEALGDPVSLMQKAHVILRELAPEPVEAPRDSDK